MDHKIWGPRLFHGCRGAGCLSETALPYLDSFQVQSSSLSMTSLVIS